MLGSCQNRLTQFRKQRGWSQEEAALRSGLSRAAVSAIERGRVVPSTAAALALARAFSCSVEDLFSLSSSIEQIDWAWPPTQEDQGRVWRAEVGGRTLLYPVENTAMGILTHDGVCRKGRLELSDSEDPRRTLVVAGCDPSAGLLAAEMAKTSPVRLLPMPRSSRKALELLAQGVVHAAGVHWSDPGNESTVRNLLGSGFRLLHLVRWEEGIVVDSSLPLSGPREILRAKLRWVGREEGSGARRCLDRLLGRGRKPVGYDHVAADHRGVVETVRSGWAQAGVCVRLVADGPGLRFFTAQVEDYELCYRADSESDPRFAALLTAVRSASYRRQLADSPGFDAALTGETRTVD